MYTTRDAQAYLSILHLHTYAILHIKALKSKTASSHLVHQSTWTKLSQNAMPGLPLIKVDGNIPIQPKVEVNEGPAFKWRMAQIWLGLDITKIYSLFDDFFSTEVRLFESLCHPVFAVRNHVQPFPIAGDKEKQQLQHPRAKVNRSPWPQSWSSSIWSLSVRTCFKQLPPTWGHQNWGIHDKW